MRLFFFFSTKRKRNNFYRYPNHLTSTQSANFNSFPLFHFVFSMGVIFLVVTRHLTISRHATQQLSLAKKQQRQQIKYRIIVRFSQLTNYNILTKCVYIYVCTECDTLISACVSRWECLRKIRLIIHR